METDMLSGMKSLPTGVGAERSILMVMEYRTPHEINFSLSNYSTDLLPLPFSGLKQNFKIQPLCESVYGQNWRKCKILTTKNLHNNPDTTDFLQFSYDFLTERILWMVTYQDLSHLFINVAVTVRI